MKEGKQYPIVEEEDDSCITAQEPVFATASVVERAIPDNIDYAHIVDDVLQITPDIEEEIAAVDRGETVSMSEFKTIFSKWL